MSVDPNEQWARVAIDSTLAGRRAGGSAADKATELRRDHPLRSLLRTLSRAPSDERSWRKGALGEQAVALHLRRLDRSLWHVFHDVPVGTRGANIDHVVIGPAGVFTVNTKNLKGRVVVTPRTLTVSGYRTSYLPKSVEEARRAARLLSTALGRPVDVRPVLALIVDDLQVRTKPSDVTIVSAGGLVPWLRSQPVRFDRRAAIAIAGVAHRPETWAGR